METSQTDSHMLPPQTAPVAAALPPAGRFFTTSVAVWAILAGAAVSYLALVIAKPDVLSAYLPDMPSFSAPEDNEGQRANVVASKDVQELRDSVGQLQLDVAQIKTDISARGERDKGIETRIAALEEMKTSATLAATAPAPGALKAGVGGVPVTPLAPTTAAAKAAAKKAQAAAAKAAAQAAAASSLVPAIPAPAAAVVQPAANAAAALAPPLEPQAAIQPAQAVAPVAGQQGVKLINVPLSASSAASRAAPPAPVAPGNPAEALAPAFETGSVQNLGVPSSEAAPEVAKAAKPLGIYIGSAPSVDGLRQSWNFISNRNPDSLANLQPRYTTGIDANGLNYGLVAGPVQSVAEAQKLCKDLAAKAVTCRVGDYSGEAL